MMKNECEMVIGMEIAMEMEMVLLMENVDGVCTMEMEMEM